MSAATEEWADWCEGSGGFAITGTRMKEHHREFQGRQVVLPLSEASRVLVGRHRP